MAVSGTEPVSVQDLGISLNGAASADGIGSQPASVEDLQLVVQGMQEKTDEQVAAVGGATQMCGVVSGKYSYKNSAGWPGTGMSGAPATGRYRVCVFATGTNSYSDTGFSIEINNEVVFSGTAADISGYKSVMVMKELDLTAGSVIYVKKEGASCDALFSVAQRIK